MDETKSRGAGPLPSLPAFPDDADVRSFDEWPPLDLPAGATVNSDGSVTLVLDHPFDLKYRAPGGDSVQIERFENLVLQRRTGADVRKMLASPDAARMAMALSLRMSLAKLAALQRSIDARDETAARDVVGELLGGFKTGLPAQAQEITLGVKLTLFRAVADGQGAAWSEIIFNRVTGSLRQQIARAPSPFDWGIALTTGMSPKAAKALVDAVDGADAIAMNMVVLFLCGSGRVGSR